MQSTLTQSVQVAGHQQTEPTQQKQAGTNKTNIYYNTK